MAYLAVYLGTGQSICGLSIKANNSFRCILAAAQLHYDLTGIDPRYQGPIPQFLNKLIDKFIKSVCDKLECWEKVPDVKNQVSIRMVQWLKQLQETTDTSPISELSAVLDWKENGNVLWLQNWQVCTI